MRRDIDLSGLPDPFIDSLEALIREYRERHPAAPAEPRTIGWARDILPDLPPEFFEDLPEDLLDLFEGKSA
jgi:hypothetical protein